MNLAEPDCSTRLVAQATSGQPHGDLECSRKEKEGLMGQREAEIEQSRGFETGKELRISEQGRGKEGRSNWVSSMASKP